MSELVKVVQLPVLEEKFKELGEGIETKVKNATDLVVTEENYKEVKKIRAALNKESSAYAAEFKGIKESVLEPWDRVEKAYRLNVVEKFKKADEALGCRIKEVEGELKEAKKKEIEAYFEELKTANGIDFVTFEDTGIKVGMSDSKKKLKETATAFIEGVLKDLDLIHAQDIDSIAEILVEYKKDFDAHMAILTVKERKEKILRQEEERKAREEAKAAEEEHRKSVEKHIDKPLAAPATKPPEEPKKKPRKSVTFRVFYEDMETVKKLAVFLKKENIEFVQL